MSNNFENMSQETTQPINIIYPKKKKNMNSISPQKPQYRYELILNNTDYIEQVCYTTYAHLITHKDKYKFNSINSYKIVVYDLDTQYCLEGTINTIENNISNQNDNIFIEFTKTNTGNTLCSCFIKNSNCIVSPLNF